MANCTSILSCESINRITKYLNEYENMSIENIEATFNNKTYPFLTDDFNHVLFDHLSDDKTIKKKTLEFQSIHNHIMSNISSCSLEKCSKFKRNNRNREMQKMSINHETEYYLDIMDTIHCFFVHAFDIGFRMKSDELHNITKNSINDNNNKTEMKYSDDINIDADMDDENGIQLDLKDPTLTTLSNILKSKRERLQNIRGTERTSHTKFVTNVTEIVDEKTDQNTKGNDLYSFGYKYNYWHRNKINYIEQKYNNLSDELINNKIFTIDKDRFNAIHNKAKHKVDCEYARTLCAMGDLRFYGFNKDVLISTEHIMAVLFYTDFDNLSHHFSSTFRSTKKCENNIYDCMKNNAEYAHWSKLLIETVNVFGFKMKDSKIKIFYHGIDNLLIFSSFVTVFNSPTSTTTQISVAGIFADANGAILELRKQHQYLRYFNCSWLSSYSAEDERLFCCAPYDNRQLRFVSIRSVKYKENYEMF
eukprot:475815_1